MIQHPRRISPAFLSVATAAAAAIFTSSAAAQQATQQAASPDAAAPVQWNGSFRSSSQVSADASNGYAFTSVSGGVRLTAAGANSLHAHITLSTNSGINDAANLHWAIANGECRNGALPLAPITSFADINVSRDRGELDADVPITLPTSGNYHVNIFKANAGIDESDVLTCASLKMSKVKK